MDRRSLDLRPLTCRHDPDSDPAARPLVAVLRRSRTPVRPRRSSPRRLIASTAARPVQESGRGARLRRAPADKLALATPLRSRPLHRGRLLGRGLTLSVNQPRRKTWHQDAPIAGERVRTSSTRRFVAWTAVSGGSQVRATASFAPHVMGHDRSRSAPRRGRCRPLSRACSATIRSAKSNAIATGEQRHGDFIVE